MWNTVLKCIFLLFFGIFIVFVSKKCYKCGIIRVKNKDKLSFSQREEEKMETRGGNYSALTIAKWFLYYNDKILEAEDADAISNLKLQKLLYYCLLYTSRCV